MRIRQSVVRERSTAATISSSESRTRTTEAAESATAAPLPTATPTSACVRATIEIDNFILYLLKYETKLRIRNERFYQLCR